MITVGLTRVRPSVMRGRSLRDRKIRLRAVLLDCYSTRLLDWSVSLRRVPVVDSGQLTGEVQLTVQSVGIVTQYGTLSTIECSAVQCSVV